MHIQTKKKPPYSCTVSHAIGLMWAHMAFGILKDLKILEWSAAVLEVRFNKEQDKKLCLLLSLPLCSGFHRNTKNLETTQSAPLLKQGHLGHVAQGHVQLGFGYVRRCRPHNLSGKPVLVFDNPHYEKLVFKCVYNILSFSVCPFPLVLSWGDPDFALFVASLQVFTHTSDL